MLKESQELMACSKKLYFYYNKELMNEFLEKTNQLLKKTPPEIKKQELTTYINTHAAIQRISDLNGPIMTMNDVEKKPKY